VKGGVEKSMRGEKKELLSSGKRGLRVRERKKSIMKEEKGTALKKGGRKSASLSHQQKV